MLAQMHEQANIRSLGLAEDRTRRPGAIHTNTAVAVYILYKHNRRETEQQVVRAALASVRADGRAYREWLNIDTPIYSMARDYAKHRDFTAAMARAKLRGLLGERFAEHCVTYELFTTMSGSTGVILIQWQADRAAVTKEHWAWEFEQADGRSPLARHTN